MDTFKSMKHCKSSLKICLKCPYIMHSQRRFLRFEVNKIFCQCDVIYKGYIAAKMKRSRQTHIIPACKHSGINKTYICTLKSISNITKQNGVVWFYSKILYIYVWYTSIKSYQNKATFLLITKWYWYKQNLFSVQHDLVYQINKWRKLYYKFRLDR